MSEKYSKRTANKVEMEGEDTLDPSKDTKPENVYPLENIKIEKMQLSIFQIKRKYEKDKTIKLSPDFQREKVWDLKQQRELIESILMGIPLPLIYLSEDKNGNLIVIDGKQRLTTFFEFMDNKFYLRDLSILKKHENVYFDKGNKFLDPKDRATIEDYQLQINVIKPPTPDRIQFDIFERVNRAGTQLNKQEMRNALYQGNSTKLLNELSQEKNFKKLTKNSVNDKRMKGKYIILRFIGFYLWKKGELTDSSSSKVEYKSDIDDFLAKVMEFLNSSENEKIKKIKLKVIETFDKILLIFDDNCFRLPTKKDKKRPINMYLFESLYYLFANLSNEIINSCKQEIINKVKDLKEDEESDYYKSLTRSTDSSTSVNERFKKMDIFFDEIHNQNFRRQ
jgi:uncharacterized protein with ParB-like and HNH nuclease domain